MKELFLPKEIWGIITLLLGENYWKKRTLFIRNLIDYPENNELVNKN